MYLPRRFEQRDLAALDELVARDAFVTVVTVDAEGMPFASHLPVLYSRSGERVVLRGHWARPNPQSRHDGPALVIVHGPHAYVTPSSYVDADSRVPTWNYALAHLRGTLQRFEEREALRALVSELAAKYENPLATGWQPAHGTPVFESDLDAIVGFELIATSVQIKFKLNQNHPAANVLGAADELEGRGEPQAREVAALMRLQLAHRHKEPSA
jgi:transcriptional regulator